MTETTNISIHHGGPRLLQTGTKQLARWLNLAAAKDQQQGDGAFPVHVSEAERKRIVGFDLLHQLDRAGFCTSIVSADGPNLVFEEDYFSLHFGPITNVQTLKVSTRHGEVSLECDSTSASDEGTVLRLILPPKLVKDIENDLAQAGDNDRKPAAGGSFGASALSYLRGKETESKVSCATTAATSAAAGAANSEVLSGQTRDDMEKLVLGSLEGRPPPLKVLVVLVTTEHLEKLPYPVDGFYALSDNNHSSNSSVNSCATRAAPSGGGNGGSAAAAATAGTATVTTPSMVNPSRQQSVFWKTVEAAVREVVVKKLQLGVDTSMTRGVKLPLLKDEREANKDEGGNNGGHATASAGDVTGDVEDVKEEEVWDASVTSLRVEKVAFDRPLDVVVRAVGPLGMGEVEEIWKDDLVARLWGRDDVSKTQQEEGDSGGNSSGTRKGDDRKPTSGGGGSFGGDHDIRGSKHGFGHHAHHGCGGMIGRLGELDGGEEESKEEVLCSCCCEGHHNDRDKIEELCCGICFETLPAVRGYSWASSIWVPVEGDALHIGGAGTLDISGARAHSSSSSCGGGGGTSTPPKHVFCNPCMMHYVAGKVNDGKVLPEDLCCPAPGCTKALSEVDILHLLVRTAIPASTGRYAVMGVRGGVATGTTTTNNNSINNTIINNYNFNNFAQPAIQLGSFIDDPMLNYHHHAAHYNTVAIPPPPSISAVTGGNGQPQDQRRHMFLKYKQFYREALIRQDPANRRYCPQRHCDNVVMLDRSPLNVFSTTACSSCRHKICNNCGQTAHPFRTCSMATNAAFSEYRRNTSEGVKACPHCSLLIEKDGGCQHMTCRNCNHQFCWICQSTWNSGCSGSRTVCRVIQVWDHPWWGPNMFVRAITKLVGLPLTVSVVATAAGVALAVGGAGAAVVVCVCGPVWLLRKIAKGLKEWIASRRAAARLEEGVPRLLSFTSDPRMGVHILLVGRSFHGFLRKYAIQQSSGRWETIGGYQSFWAYPMLRRHGELSSALLRLTVWEPVGEERTPPPSGHFGGGDEEGWDIVIVSGPTYLVANAQQFTRRSSGHVIVVEPYPNPNTGGHAAMETAPSSVVMLQGGAAAAPNTTATATADDTRAPYSTVSSSAIMSNTGNASSSSGDCGGASDGGNGPSLGASALGHPLSQEALEGAAVAGVVAIPAPRLAQMAVHSNRLVCSLAQPTMAHEVLLDQRLWSSTNTTTTTTTTTNNNHNTTNNIPSTASSWADDEVSGTLKAGAVGVLHDILVHAPIWSEGPHIGILRDRRSARVLRYSMSSVDDAVIQQEV